MKKTKYLISVYVVVLLLLCTMFTIPVRASLDSPSQNVASENEQGWNIGKAEAVVANESSTIPIVIANESSTNLIMNLISPEGQVATVNITRTGTQTTFRIEGVGNSTVINLPSVASSVVQSSSIQRSSLTNQSSETIGQILSSLQSSGNISPQPANLTSASSTMSAAAGAAQPNLSPMYAESYIPNVNYYVWDGLNFVSGPGIQYPHADEGYSPYQINPWYYWQMDGNQLEHMMFDQTDSHNYVSDGAKGISQAIATGVIAAALLVVQT